MPKVMKVKLVYDTDCWMCPATAFSRMVSFRTIRTLAPIVRSAGVIRTLRSGVFASVVLTLPRAAL